MKANIKISAGLPFAFRTLGAEVVVEIGRTLFAAAPGGKSGTDFWIRMILTDSAGMTEHRIGTFDSYEAAEAEAKNGFAVEYGSDPRVERIVILLRGAPAVMFY